MYLVGNLKIRIFDFRAKMRHGSKPQSSIINIKFVLFIFLLYGTNTLAYLAQPYVMKNMK
jgi:hypothetical protein